MNKKMENLKKGLSNLVKIDYTSEWS